MVFFYLFLLLLLCSILYLRQCYSRFSKYGVAHFKPVPLLGNAVNVALRKCYVGIDYQNLYNAFPNDRFMGRFELTRPIILIRDLELLKKVTVKDYEYFLDHRTIVDGSVDTLFGRSLFSLGGQEWKDMRSTLSPAFTSSKIKSMVPFMMEVNKQMVDVLIDKIKDTQTGFLDIDIKDVTTKYTNDVIASCAFGVKVDSHRDDDNEFYSMGLSSSSFGFRKMMVFLGYGSFPSIMKNLNLKLFEDNVKHFFKNLVMTNMEDRETKNIFRPDMIHLLMEAKKGKLIYDSKTTDEDAGFATAEESDIGKRVVNREWSDDDLTAQAFIFFLAGFETVSSTLTILLHELAANPDVQEKLYQEIEESEKKTGGRLDYKTVQSLKYLDMVVSEALRLWPAVPGLDRICVKDYNLGKSNEKSKQEYIIRKGELIGISTYAMHRDPDYFPDPGRFDPERFSDENKDDIKPFTYLPFGSGPRNCIGSRFALCEMKVMVYQFLKSIRVAPCEKTRLPITLSPKYLTLVIEGGHWLRLTLRKSIT